MILYRFFLSDWSTGSRDLPDGRSFPLKFWNQNFDFRIQHTRKCLESQFDEVL